MLLSVLLAVAVGVHSVAPGTGFSQGRAALAAPSHAEAEQLAADGEVEQALDAFQRIAAANPNDHEARLWIARLHVLMDNPARAEPVYRSVALEDPSNVRASVGIANTLLARYEHNEALDILAGTERLAPEDPEVLAALGRAHVQAGHTTIAVSYLQRAVALAPTPEHRAALERARLVHGHRVEGAGLFERFDRGVDDTRGLDLTLNVRLKDSLRLIGRGQIQKKFGFSEERGGAGLEWRWKPSTTLHGYALIGPDNVVLGETEVHGGIDHVIGPVEWTFGVRYVDFASARVTVFSPGLAWQATSRLALSAQYALMSTDRETTLASERGQSVRLDGSYRFYPRLWLIGGYAGGVDRFDALSIDRVGDFRANSLTAGVRLPLASLSSLTGLYERSWRDDDFNMGRVTVSVGQSF